MFLIQGKCKLINRLIKNYKSKQSKENETPRNGILYVITKCLVIINCEDTERVIAAPSPSLSPGAKREAWSWKTKTAHYWSERNRGILESGVCYQSVVETRTEKWDKEQAAPWFGKRYYNPLVSQIWRTLVVLNMAHDWSLETDMSRYLMWWFVISYMWYSMTSTQLFSHSLKQGPVPAPSYPIHVGLSEGQNFKKRQNKLLLCRQRHGSWLCWVELM